MATVAILGAGPVGAELAAVLAFRQIAGRVLLIDEDAPSRAAGKALDIAQACPVARADARVAWADRAEAASVADLIVVADRATDGREWEGEAGLALAARALGDRTVPVLLTGASQLGLLERAVVELAWSRAVVVGSAALAYEAGIRAMAALEADCAVSDVHLAILGRPPEPVKVMWETARIAGRPALDRLDPPAVRRIDARLKALWPPGPFALATAAARFIRPLLGGPEETLTCFTATASEPASASAARIGRGTVK
jgi:malate/lactate dehydrogenase